MPLGLDQVSLLIRINALRFTGKGKKELLWDVHLVLGNRKKRDPVRERFPVRKREFTLPELEQTSLESSYDELEILGFAVSIPAFELLQTAFRGEIRSRQMIEHVGKKVRMLLTVTRLPSMRTFLPTCSIICRERISPRKAV